MSYCYLEPLNLDGFRPSTWIKRCEIYNIEFFGNGKTILPIPNTKNQKTNSVWLTGAKFQKKYGQICVIDNLQTTPKVLELFQSGEIGGTGTGYVARTTDTFSSSDDQYLIYAAPPVFGERGPLGPPDYSYLPCPSCLDAPFLGSYEVAAGTSITWTDNRYTVGLSPFGMGIGKYFNNVPLKAAHGVFLIKPDFYK